ncbi:MAG: hypothetical protein ACKOYC_11025, partial [Bacteroidota bacterium]
MKNRYNLLTSIASKAFILFALVAIVSVNAFAQVATIGTGALSSTTYGPIYRSSTTSTFNHSAYAYLYTSAELTAAGVTPGATLNSVAWFKNSAFNMSGSASGTLTIYMKNTSNTALTSSTTWGTFLSGATLVKTITYNAASNLPATTGWVTVPLTTPFTVTGALEIYVSWSITGTSPFSTGAFNWLYASGLPSTSALGYASGTVYSPSSALTTTYGGAARPNIQIGYSLSPCSGTPAPGNTVASPTEICPNTSSI